MDVSALMELVELLAIIIAMFLVYRSVPAEKVGQLIDKAGQHAETTDTKLDDLLVNLAEMLAGLQRETESKPENVVKSE